MFKTILLFIVAVLFASLLTSLVSTQIVMSELNNFGIQVSLTDRLYTTAKDLLGLGGTLFILIAPGFLIGFIVAKYAHRLIGGNRTLWYITAGFTSFPITLFLIKYFMVVTPLASARTSIGMLLIACCCMLSAWMFANISASINSKETDNEKL
jgi:hypothetical protein